MRIVTKLGVALVLVAAVGVVLAQPGYAGPDPCGDGGSDSDCDTVVDLVDNCLGIPNGAGDPMPQCDTDSDGYGNACDADVNNDGVVGNPDYVPITNNFGQPVGAFPGADINCDGVIGNPDYVPITNLFARPVGPSGLSCAGTIPCP